MLSEAVIFSLSMLVDINLPCTQGSTETKHQVSSKACFYRTWDVLLLLVSRGSFAIVRGNIVATLWRLTPASSISDETLTPSLAIQRAGIRSRCQSIQTSFPNHTRLDTFNSTDSLLASLQTILADMSPPPTSTTKGGCHTVSQETPPELPISSHKGKYWTPPSTTADSIRTWALRKRR